jgi:hypothetical protein
MSTLTQYYPLGGGLDVVTPALSVNPGRLITCINFEPHFNDGYRRILGYERYDGHPRPHRQTFIGFDLVDATGLTTGTVVTGDVSGAVGTVIGISGNSIGVTKVTGTFVVDEGLNTATWTIASTPTPTVRQAPDQATEDAFLLAAWDEYRQDIGVVPGAGNVNGVWRLLTKTYAWRNNVGETAGIMHTDSGTGWTTTGVTLTDYVKFDAGTDTPGPVWVEGDTVTGLTSGASGTIHRLTDWAGGYGTNDATGFLVLTGVTGGPFSDNEALQVGGVTIALANGASSTFAFSPGGNYQFHSHNFFATTNSYNAYGCNGVDDAFEIDQNGVVSPILIPTVTDLVGVTANNVPPDGKPFLIEEHNNTLFMAFPGGRMVSSSPGLPLNFSSFLDAAEFGMGDEITGLNSVVGSVLVVTSDRETRGLFGSNVLDWELKLIGEQTGGRLYSTQKLDTVYALDDLGVTSVARTDTFGDFAGATVSQLVQPIINVLRELITDSTIVRKSNQYRMYFSDNSCLIMYIPAAGSINEERGTGTAINVQFGSASYPIPILRIYNTEDAVGNERTFFASNDGYVYEDQVGTNFDGANIRSYIRTAFTHMGTPALRKKFRRLDVELSSSRPLAFKIASDLSYGAPEASSGITDLESTDIPTLDIFSGGGFWDTDNWDEFYWDGQNIASARAQLGGTGENIGFLVFHDSAVDASFILQGFTIHYDKRRLQR